MNETLTKLIDFFSLERLLYYLSTKLLPNILIVITIFLSFFIFWKILSKILKAVFGKVKIDSTIQSFIQSVLKYLILIVGFITALAQAGINTGSFIASLGVAGLTIGFAAKDTLSNIISGLFIFWDRPFVLGDLVEIGGFYGEVSEITMRSTRVITVDGKMLAIPNSQVVNTIVVSYTNFPHLRLDIGFTIGINENISSIRELILGLLEDDKRFKNIPAPQVIIKSINDYNIEIVLMVWLFNEKNHIQVRNELRETIFKELMQVGVEMPFETIEVKINGKE